MTDTTKKAAPRGFAAMDPQRQREIAQRGGQEAHRQGRAHKFTPEEASAAGKKRAAQVAALRATGK